MFRSVGKRSEGVSGRGLKKRRSDEREIKEQGKGNITACACALGHASSCDEGSCVGCMGDDVVGWCSGGVELKGKWTQMWTCTNFQLTSLTCSHIHTEPIFC